MNEWPTISMDSFQSMMLLRKQIVPAQSVGGFDPYQVMLKRKQNSTEDETKCVDIPVQSYDSNDIKELEEFCQQYGIVGFNFGNMHPKTALQMLKSKMGIVKENVVNKKILYG